MDYYHKPGMVKEGILKKINELNTPVTDVNSPESQKFLRELHNRLTKENIELKELIEQWIEEDRNNENKRNN